MYMATDEDVERVKEIIKRFYEQKDREFDISELEEKSIEILEIAYSIGGDYGEDCIKCIVESMMGAELIKSAEIYKKLV